MSLPLPLEPDSTMNYAEMEPITTAGEQVAASFDLSVLEMPTRQIMEWRALNELKAEAKQKIKADDLNQMYPGMEEPFTEDMNEYAAQFVYDAQQEKHKHQAVISNGYTGMGGFALNLAGGAIPQVLDPINLTANIALSGGLGYVGTSARFAGTAAQATLKTVGYGKSGLLAGVAREAVEDVAAGTVAEFPKMLTAASRQEEFNLETFNNDVIYNAVIFGGAKLGYRGIKSQFFKGADFIKNISPQYADVTAKTAIAHVEQGYVPNVDPLIKDAVLESAPKSLEPTTVRDPNTFFTSTKKEDFYSERNHFTENYGNVITLGSAEEAVDGAGARKLGDGVGYTHEVSLKDGAKLIDLNKPLDPEVLSIVKNHLGEYSDITGVDLTNLTGKELLDGIKEMAAFAGLDDDAMALLQKDLEAADFSGYRVTLSETAGVPHNPHDVVMLFNDKHLEKKSVRQAKQDGIHQASKEELKDMNAKTFSNENKIDYDKDAEVLAKQYESKVVEPDTEKLLLKEEEDIIKELEEKDSLGELDEFDKAAYEEVKVMKAQDSVLLQVLESMKGCLGL